MVIVSRNLERANKNDGFKMTALESIIKAIAGCRMKSVMSEQGQRHRGGQRGELRPKNLEKKEEGKR